MSLEPTRKEWLAALEQMMAQGVNNPHTATVAILGPCPSESLTENTTKGDSG